jgi:Bacterial regulatory proteins, tetR family.
MAADARVRYTKMVIASSFVHLLKHEPIARVTVTEICRSAEINRSTFYKYYDNPFDLLTRIEDELLDELRPLIEPRHGAVSKKLTAVLEKIRTDGTRYAALFSENGDPEFSSRVLRLCYDELSSDVGGRFPDMPAHQQQWSYYFIAQGCNAVVNTWMGSGMKEPPEEVAAFIDRTLSTLFARREPDSSRRGEAPAR